MMRQLLVVSYSLSLAIWILISCASESPKDQLLLPGLDQLEVISGKSETIITNPEFRLVIFLSGDCFDCISELNQWQTLRDSLQFSVELSFEPYVYSYDFDRFKSFIKSQSSLDIEFPLIMDVNQVIYNSILLPEGLENSKSAYLLNSKNEIVVEGYPLGDHKTLSKYVNALKAKNLLP